MEGDEFVKRKDSACRILFFSGLQQAQRSKRRVKQGGIELLTAT
jgi:hypothetical protein